MNLLDGSGYLVADACIAVLMCACAVLTFARIAFVDRLRFTFSRMVMGTGWTILALRMVVSVLAGIDVIIAPVSILGFTFLCSGYCAVQILAIRRGNGIA